MAYQYSPEEELKRRQAQQPQPSATVPSPAANGDPFKRNSTGVAGNTESRYGAVAPQRTSVPDAFQRPPQLLVPSPALAEAQPPSAVPPQPVPAAVAPVPTVTATTPQPVPAAPGATPFPGTLPGGIPQPNALPTSPRALLPDELDPFKRRRTALV